ncbi:hypothetical protein [Sphingorhabdus contaminans]|uniref:Uncharacterized protein n=1 Tax=Sphingorhabdus contaminans TaxID=1343899 RepID=A0A553WA54_9SPHN|nr:hypothetical protein [Sphingorhabdus contaminans]TSB01577.1 hypothetical protein FOM92_10335 [Sphingorhabdus contaminans]
MSYPETNDRADEIFKLFRSATDFPAYLGAQSLLRAQDRFARGALLPVEARAAMAELVDAQR